MSKLFYIVRVIILYLYIGLIIGVLILVMTRTKFSERTKKTRKRIRRSFPIINIENSGFVERHKIFCQEYIYDWNATRAYKVAYPHVKTSTAGISGHLLLKDPKIREFINEIQADIEKQAGISRLRIAREYEKMAFSNIADLHNTWVEKKRFDELTDAQKASIVEISTRITKKVIGEDNGGQPVFIQVEEIKIKLHDKTKALEGLRKMLGYDAPDKLNITGSIEHKKPEELQVDELSKGAQELLFEINQKQLTEGIRDN